MAITLGNFKLENNGSFQGTFKTLTVAATLTIVPNTKNSDNAPDYRVYSGYKSEIGAGWNRVAKNSGETYVNLKIAVPEFGPRYIHMSLVKMAQEDDLGCTHRLIWNPEDAKE